MKTCGTCKTEKPLSDFNKSSRSKDGRQYHCRECSKAAYKNNKDSHLKRVRINRKRYLKEVHDYIWDYLLKHPCASCGESNPVLLEFDHLRDKQDNVCTMVNLKRPLRLIKKEIVKCQVLCANCHRLKTAQDGKHWTWLRSSVG